MRGDSRLPAVLAYIPIVGWLYVLVFQRKNLLATYHLRQSIGLVLFLVAAFVAWIVVAWIVAWIPYMAVLSMALFTVVIMALFYGFAVWIMGLMNALRNRLTPLPLFGRWASRLPIK
jgi:uncharacterized membrane protein